MWRWGRREGLTNGLFGCAQAGSAHVLPPMLAQLSTLQRLALCGCGLTAAPHTLLAMRGLTHLDLEGNSLSALPLIGPAPNSSTRMGTGSGCGGLARTSASAAAAPAAPATSADCCAGEAWLGSSLVHLNMAFNRFASLPQGLSECR